MVRLLAIMGSGETAPTMVKPHRGIFERLGDAPAVLLDTPYGFQENATDISTRAAGYFAASVGRAVEVLSWRTAPPAGLGRERALAALGGAGWIFAGPGSPTYALRQWRDTPLPGLLAERLSGGGAVVFASAAALTLGSHTVPVYEIYKAGLDPHWVPGLDLVRAATGLPAVIIPHYNNAEGGHHDTRFCYLGERRLSRLESELPEESFILGVDEHTVVVLDLDSRTASVMGNGTMTIRRAGHGTVYRSGSVVGLDDLASASRPGTAGPGTAGLPTAGPGTAGPAPAGTASGPAGAQPGSAGAELGAAGLRLDAVGPERATVAVPADGSAPSGDSLRADADRLDVSFDAAHAARDVDGCVSAILDLEQALVDWSADTLTSGEGDHARAVLRRMVVRLGELAAAGTGGLAPLVDALIDARRRARDGRDFATSDRIRDQLAAAGIEVRDTPTGMEWMAR
jgi:cyanophycinase-like exopeptidase